MSEENEQSTPLQYQSIYDLSGGMVTNWNYYKIRRDQFFRLLNGDLVIDATVRKRKGRVKVNTTPVPGNPAITSLATIGQTSGPDFVLAGGGGTLNEISGGSPILIKSGLNPAAYLANTTLDNFVFYCNGVDKPFMTEGTAATTFDVGIAQFTTVQYGGITIALGPAAVPPFVGLTAGTHRFAYRYRSTITGARSLPYIVMATVDGTPEEVINGSTTVVAIGGESLNISVLAAAVSPDPQVDVIDIFMQEANVAVDASYYFITTVSNIVGGPYNIPDANTPDISDLANILRERLDVDDNQPPTTLRDIENWRGRLLGIVDDYHVQFSKQRIDANGFVNLPTSWPSLNSLEVGFGDGDPLVKVIRFYDYILAFKRRSIWVLNGDYNAPNFGFKRLKTNYSSVGLLNQKSVAQASDKIFFVSDNLRFHYFRITDFSTEEIRLAEPIPSDPIGDLFITFASSFRDNVNLVSFSYAYYTQIWVAFSDGSSGLDSTENFNVFVYDYGNEKGAWHVHTGIEVASSILARDSNRDYSVYTGDYYGFVWKNGVTDGDGAFINGTSSGGNTPTTFNDTTQTFTPDLIGTFIRILDGPGANQIRRIIAVPLATQIVVTPAWVVTPTSTSTYTIGGIDFQLWSRFDWCDEAAPPDFDKYGWYLDIDAETAGNYSFTVDLLKDRDITATPAVARIITLAPAAMWGSGIWGVDYWATTNKITAQVGFDLYFKQIQHRIINNLAGQFIKISGWTYTYQQVQHLRLF